MAKDQHWTRKKLRAEREAVTEARKHAERAARKEEQERERSARSVDSALRGCADE